MPAACTAPGPSLTAGCTCCVSGHRWRRAATAPRRDAFLSFAAGRTRTRRYLATLRRGTLKPFARASRAPAPAQRHAGQCPDRHGRGRPWHHGCLVGHRPSHRAYRIDESCWSVRRVLDHGHDRDPNRLPSDQPVPARVHVAPPSPRCSPPSAMWPSRSWDRPSWSSRSSPLGWSPPQQRSPGSPCTATPLPGRARPPRDWEPERRTAVTASSWPPRGRLRLARALLRWQGSGEIHGLSETAAPNLPQTPVASISVYRR
jgi:hypothetical protein